MPPPLAGARAFITGGASGIGLAIARRFAADGAHCTLIGRNVARLEAAVASLPASSPYSSSSPLSSSAAGPQQHRIFAGDVRHRSTWEELWSSSAAGRQQSEGGGRQRGGAAAVDILVNAAGVTQESLLARTPPETVVEILETNLQGTIWGCQTAVRPMMRSKRGGCIINVSSLLAQKGGRGAAVYAASKAGVIGLTHALAKEVGQFGIRVNVLVPGYIQTSMTEGLAPDKTLTSAIPLGRFGTPDEVAEAAAFLATNGYANNCVLNLDGGLSAI